MFKDIDGDPNYQPLTESRLKGPASGFIWSNTGRHWLGTFDDEPPYWQPLFERLLRAAPSDISFSDKPSSTAIEEHKGSISTSSLVGAPSPFTWHHCGLTKLLWWISHDNETEHLLMTMTTDTSPACLRSVLHKYTDNACWWAFVLHDLKISLKVNV